MLKIEFVAGYSMLLYQQGINDLKYLSDIPFIQLTPEERSRIFNEAIEQYETIMSNAKSGLVYRKMTMW